MVKILHLWDIVTDEQGYIVTVLGGVRPKYSISHDGDRSSRKEPPCGDDCYKIKNLTKVGLVLFFSSYWVR